MEVAAQKTRTAGGLFIVDEVQSSFGKTGDNHSGLCPSPALTAITEVPVQLLSWARDLLGCLPPYGCNVKVIALY